MWYSRSRCVLVATTASRDLSDDRLVNGAVAYRFHHCQMLEVIVRLKQRITREELDQNTSDTPNIARIAPSEVQDDLGSTVVPCRYYRRMILVVECGRTKVDQSDFRIEEHSSKPSRSLRGGRGGWYVAVVRKGLVGVVDEQDVLRLQVSVNEVEIVEDCQKLVIRRTRRLVDDHSQATLVKSCLAKCWM